MAATSESSTRDEFVAVIHRASSLQVTDPDRHLRGHLQCRVLRSNVWRCDPVFSPPADSRRRAWSTLKITIRTVERAMKSGDFTNGDSVNGARLIWAAMHGVVSLQLSGYFATMDHPNVLYEEAVAGAIQRLRK